MSLDFPEAGTAFWEIHAATDVRPEYLIPVLYLESKFDPSIVNSIGCVGLNQLCKMNYVMMGTDVQTYRGYLASKQLRTGVLTYIRGVAGKIHSGTMMMIAQFGQSKVARVHALADKVLNPGPEYDQNPGFDNDGKGYAAAGDIARVLSGIAKRADVQKAIAQAYEVAPGNVGARQDAIYGTDFPESVQTERTRVIFSQAAAKTSSSIGTTLVTIGIAGTAGYIAYKMIREYR